MKILLVGEYNSSHGNLKTGLLELGHEVTVVGFGDGFKKRSVDIHLKRTYSKGIAKLFKNVLYKIFGWDVSSYATKRQFYRHHKIFEDNDIVQLINEHIFFTTPKIEIELLSHIFKHNRNVYLLSCGTDHISIKYAFEDRFRYSILTPYLENRVPKKVFQPALKYLQPEFEAIHDYIFDHINGIISSDLDYHIPLAHHPLYLGLAPNPIIIDDLPYIEPLVTDKIIVFHGINRNNYFKKGNDIFEKALDIIQRKYPEKLEIITVENVPYKEYIQLYNRAHILLDQVYAYDQGFNALEGMAKGKVVFTGAEMEWLEFYNLQADTVAINALPDPTDISRKLEWLVLNPDKIAVISKAARKFVEQEHDHILSAKIYLNKWQSRMIN